MRTSRPLILSLALNVVLLAVWWQLRTQAPRPAGKPPAAVVPRVETMVSPAESARPEESALAAPVVLPFRWQHLESDDPREFVANLRQVQCPEVVLRELLVTRLERSYAPRLEAQPVYYDPWVSQERQETDRRLERRRQQLIRQEQAALIRELLGYDWHPEIAREWVREEMAGVFLGFLPPEKAQQVMATVMTAGQGFEDKFGFFRQRIILDEDIEEARQFRAELGQQLARFLSPAELDELETRAQLGLLATEQIHLDGMEPTGAELRTIFSVSRRHRDFLSNVLLSFSLSREERTEWPGRTEFDAELVRHLGAARAADFQRAQDASFRSAFAFTTEADLPKSVAVTLYEARRTALAQQRELETDTALTPEERRVALEVLQTATMATLAHTLGPKFTNYLGQDGEWLKRLAGGPKPGATTRRGNR